MTLSRYPFSAMRERLALHGKGALDFALGGAALPLDPVLEEVVSAQPHLALRRSSRGERQRFAEAAVEMLCKIYRVEVETECILPAPAGRLAMSALVAATLEPGDQVLVTEPGYPSFARIARQLNAEVHAVRLSPRSGFHPDFEGFPGLDGIRLAALNYPNNPTGGVLSKDSVVELGNGLAHDAILFNDAVYGPLVHDDEPISLLRFHEQADLPQPAIELHSLAKLYALGPLGISFFVGTPELIESLRHYTEFVWAPLSSLQIELATRALEDAELLGGIRRFFSERVARLRSVIVDLGFDPYPTPAGMYVLSCLPNRIADTPVATAQQAADLLLDQYDVAVMPWDHEPDAYLRFSALYKPNDLEKLAGIASRGPIAC